MAKYDLREKFGWLVDEIKERFVQKQSGKDLSTNDFSNLLKQKLDGVEEGANKYTHPANHTPDIITETTAKQFIDKARKDKIDGIEAGAKNNVIELIKRNGTNVAITNKAVDILVPTKLSDLTNDKTFQTKAEIITLIGEKGKLKKEVVATLPAVGVADENTLYLVASDNGFAEWFVINGAWEKMGDTGDIDLTGYVKHEDITTVTKAEIVAMFNA